MPQSTREAALFDRGLALQERGELIAAIAVYDELLGLDPNVCAAHSNRGAALAQLNRCDDALASFDRAIALKPDHAQAHFGRAIALLTKGDLVAGFAEFEWRWQTVPGRALRASKHFSQPLWLGAQDVSGKTLLLYSERGLGDTLQFCRYAPLAEKLGARVILQVQAPLAVLLQSLPGNCRVVSETEPLPPFDFQCPLLSLPHALKTSLSTLPAPRRYLSASASEVAQLRARWGAGDKPRIGLVWRGDASNPDDRRRSVTLSQLLPHLPNDLHYFSLQKELTPSERRLIDAHPNFQVLEDSMGFEATAALCECMDLVLAVDTCIAHLAAALGSRTWVLLPFNADCRWMLERKDSPWYPSATLYRQSAAGEWPAVLARVGADLSALPTSV